MGCIGLPTGKAIRAPARDVAATGRWRPTTCTCDDYLPAPNYGTEGESRVSNCGMRWTIITALAAMLTTACQVEPPPLPSSWAQTSRRLRLPGELTNRDQLRTELDRAQKQWTKERPLEYELTVVRGYDNPGTFVSVVRGVNVLRSRGGYRPNGRDVAPSLRTVEGLFDEAQKATMFPFNEVEITFDERFGYPNRVRIDPHRGNGDHEVTLSASITVIVR